MGRPTLIIYALVLRSTSCLDILGSVRKASKSVLRYEEGGVLIENSIVAPANVIDAIG
jgi:hypothetical protein